jgi:transposase
MGVGCCKIEAGQQLQLVELFVAEVTARTAAELTDLHRNTVALFYHKLRG